MTEEIDYEKLYSDALKNLRGQIPDGRVRIESKMKLLLEALPPISDMESVKRPDPLAFESPLNITLKLVIMDRGAPKYMQVANYHLLLGNPKEAARFYTYASICYDRSSEFIGRGFLYGDFQELVSERRDLSAKLSELAKACNLQSRKK